MYQRNSFVKRFIIILSLLSFLFPKDDKHGCISGDCSNGKGAPDGRKYVGEFRNGLLNGPGTYTSSDGFSCEGDFKGKNVTSKIS